MYAYKGGLVVYADAEGHEGEGRVSQVPPPPLSELVRTYIVYTLCSVPFLVDWSPTILSTLMAIPGIKQITEAVVRVTFFDQVRLSSPHPVSCMFTLSAVRRRRPGRGCDSCT